MHRLKLNLSIIGYFALLPLFLSFSDSFVTFNRAPWLDNEKYIFTISLNFFLVLLIFRKYLIDCFYSFIISKIFFISLLIMLLKFIVDFNLPFLLFKNILGICVFVYIVKLSCSYFSNKVDYPNLQNFNYLYIIPSLIHITIILACVIIFEKPSYLFENFIIYNFQQYLALAFLPILYIHKNLILRIITFSILQVLIFFTSNYTAFAIVLFFMIIKVTPIYLIGMKNQIFIIMFLIIFLIFFGFFYAFFGLETLIAELTHEGGFPSRIIMVQDFFSNLNYINFFFPFFEINYFYSHNEFHSQYLNLYYSFGIFIFYMIFKVMIFIEKIYKINRDIALLIISILFIGSITINPLLHPYLSVYFGVLVGYLLSIIKINDNIYKTVK